MSVRKSANFARETRATCAGRQGFLEPPMFMPGIFIPGIFLAPCPALDAESAFALAGTFVLVGRGFGEVVVRRVLPDEALDPEGCVIFIRGMFAMLAAVSRSDIAAMADES